MFKNLKYVKFMNCACELETYELGKTFEPEKVKIRVEVTETKNGGA